MKIQALHLAALVGAAVVLSEPAQAEIVPPVWDPAGQFTKQTHIAPGKFVEVCEKLPRGAKVTWRFESATPLDFNVHYHEGNKVRFPTKKGQTKKAAGVLKVKLAQDYCWMWTNKAAGEAALKLELQRS